MIEARKLTKRYGDLTAIDQVSFAVDKGEVLGFIGPNGAGKTTTMRILTGFLPATEGVAIVAGHDVFASPREVKRAVGYLPETPPLYRELTVGQYLKFVAQLREVPASESLARIGSIMERVGLTGWESRILGSLSKGYRQRVGIAQALVHDPQVLILDEPTSGLDPAQNLGVRRLIAELATERTVILSTHILREVEALASRVVVIDRSRIVANGTLEEVCAHGGDPAWHVEFGGGAPDTSEQAVVVGDLSVVTRVHPRTDGVLEVSAPADPREEISRMAAAKGWQIASLEAHLPGLEAAFLSLIGEEAA